MRAMNSMIEAVMMLPAVTTEANLALNLIAQLQLDLDTVMRRTVSENGLHTTDLLQ
jgi:hypothetical protein